MVDVVIEDGESSEHLERLHPRFAGEARVWEMIRAFWPFTRGKRLLVAVQIVVSIAFFTGTALIPLQVGNLLEAALSSSGSASGIKQFVVDPVALQKATQTMLAPVLLTPTERIAAGKAVRAADDRLRVTGADEVLNALFPGNLTYRTERLPSIDDPEPGWETIADGLLDAPTIRRRDLDDLRARALDNPDLATGKAFNYVIGVLLEDQTALRQRVAWQRDRFRFELIRFAVVLLAIFALRAVALFLAQRSTLASARRLQDAVFDRIHNSALVEAGALARPSMVSRCTSYVEKVTEALLKAQTSGVPAVAALLLSTSLLLYIDLGIGLLMLGVIAFFEILRRAIANRWSRLAHERLDLNTAMSEVVDDAIASAVGTRSIRAEATEQRRFTAKADAVIRQVRRVEVFGESFRLSAFGIGQLGVLAAIAIVGFARDQLTLAEAAAIILYVREVAAALEALPPMIVDLQVAAPYMRRLRRVLAAPLLRPSPEIPVPLPDAPGVLALDSVSTTCPDGSPGCSDVRLHATPNTWTVLVGLAGSGIPSVMSIAAGLEIPQRGRVTVDGVDLSNVDTEHLRRGIAVIPENPTVFEGTIAENLSWGRPDADPASLAAATAACGLDAWIAEQSDGVQTVIGRARTRIAAEVRVRIALGRVLLSNARIVVITDPSRLVDREVAEDLWATLRSHLTGRIVLVTTDRLDLVSDTDNVLCLRNGSVVEQGTRSDLLASNGPFAALWTRLVEGGDPIDEFAAVPSLAQLSPSTLRSLGKRLLTERFEPDEIIFAEHEPANHLYLVVDGVVDLVSGGRRIASIHPGFHFGDFDTAAPGTRTMTARARSTVVVRSLHRLAISSGVAGILDRPEAERTLYRWLTRHGSASREDLASLADRIDVDTTLTALLGSGSISLSVDPAGATVYRVAGANRSRVRDSGVLDSLFGN